MAASTITRDTLTDDSGSFSAPAGDGTIINNSVLQNDIYARIDAMFAGAGAYATLELGGTLTVDGFGSNLFSAAGTGLNGITVCNTAAGTGNYAGLTVGNDADAALSYLYAFSSTWTTSASNVASGMKVGGQGAGGVSIEAAHASGAIRFYAGGATERGRMFASGGFSWGDTTDPGATNFRVAGTVDVISGSLLVGAIGNATGALSISPITAGAGGIGPSIIVGENISGSGAAGSIGLATQSVLVGYYYVWADHTGVLRVKNAPPVEDGGSTSDTSGTIVGTQSSTLDTKQLLGRDLEPSHALAVLLRTPVKHFRYKSDKYGGTQFHGVIADWSPEFAMDPSPDHPSGRSFNPVNAFGYSVLAFQALDARLAALETRMQ